MKLITPIAIVLLTFVAIPGLGATEHAWQLQRKDDGVTIYTRDKAPRRIREIKAIGFIDAPAHACRNVVEDLGNFKHFMPYTKDSGIVAREPDGSIITYQWLSLPLVSDRDYILRVVDQSPYSSNGETPAFYQIAWTVAAKEGPPPRAGVVRVAVNTGYWHFDSIDQGNRTKATYYCFIDPGGSLPDFIINLANTTAIPSLFKALRTQAPLAKYQTPRLFPQFQGNFSPITKTRRKADLRKRSAPKDKRNSQNCMASARSSFQ